MPAMHGDHRTNKAEVFRKHFTLGTRAGHDRQCELIEENPELSKAYGLCRRSILCNSRYFHVADGMPGDAMHDILEGVLQYVCKELLKHFIFKEKFLTLEQLNERMNSFDYGNFNDKNKPSPITRTTLRSENNSLKQKARQMWCLGKFLPLALGSAIPQDEEKWMHFLLLLKIVDIVFSPITNTDELAILEGYLKEFCGNSPSFILGFQLYPRCITWFITQLIFTVTFSHEFHKLASVRAN
ncbi:uncharacterized protein LOC124442044 isoform X1 [Xenia sp. Carnegie-2017]|uniref:uncharacterized protein LOC124442044 isoform X1 n=1 Tax=Xenia sp. Carnegie-2017 TaxID=2897299 RepID=UPI001F04F1A6|nr:uncharacterized protein LOC124442044 isoform X1 [Xenia sp. Carnegie-2017]